MSARQGCCMQVWIVETMEFWCRALGCGGLRHGPEVSQNRPPLTSGAE